MTNVAVHPAARRGGIATHLLLALADEGRRRECTAWTLEVRVSSTGAQELYRRFGFVPAGIRPRYYENTEDAIVMWCNDLTSDEYGEQLDQIRAELTRGRRSMSVDESTLVLGIETSCDETAAALVMGGFDVVSSVVSTQVELHAEFGGVVPEIASRAHLEVLNPVVARTIVEAGVDDSRIDAVACTVGPGLIGALLVGVSAAKSLALAWDVPFVGVNHLEAHLYSAFLEDPNLEFPLVVLLVSGGHTMLIEMRGHGDYRLIGQTIDDAAGEAFDKVARFLDLGYPGRPGDRPRLAARRPRGDPLPAGDDGRRVRLLVQRTEDVGAELRPQASRRRFGRCGRVVPDGGRRRARHQGPSGGRVGRRHRASCSAAVSPPTRCCANRSSTPASRTASRASCRAAPCAPTTRR